jgi:hypothetical protein
MPIRWEIVPRQVHRAAGPVRVHIERARWLGVADAARPALDHVSLRLFAEIENSGMQPFMLRRIEVTTGHRGAARDIADIAIAWPGMPMEGAIAVIPPGERVNMALTLPDALRGDITPLALQVGDGTYEAESQAQEWFLVPVSADELDARGRITLAVQGIGGAMWLPNPANADELAAARVSGLGIRVSYGINRMLAFEADVLGMSAGEATFDDDSARSASLARIQIGGVLQFGQESVIPSVRAAAGLQFGTLEAGMPTGTDNVFTASLVYNLGIGLDYRFTEHLIGGIRASAGRATALDSGGPGGSIEAGIHLGYSWNPSRRKTF